jgi:hypothetical protein
VGSLLSRVALGAFLRAASEMREHGTFSFADEAAPYQDLNQSFGELPTAHWNGERQTANRTANCEL